MKTLLFTALVLALCGCQDKPAQHTRGKFPENPLKQKPAAVNGNPVTADEFCDTTRIADFKSNLKQAGNTLAGKEKEYQLKQAQVYSKQSCERDSLFCGEISFKKSVTYGYDSQWKLLLTGYVLGEEGGMEEASASFFVLTVFKNSEPVFTDVLDDLMGEIQVTLHGFEPGEGKLTVWGEAYPYFNNDYGKFRLTVQNGVGSYEYECHAEH